MQENWQFFAANGKCNVYLNILKFCLHIFLQCLFWFCFLFIFLLGNWVLRKHDWHRMTICMQDWNLSRHCLITEKRLQNLSSFDFGILFMRSSWNATIPFVFGNILTIACCNKKQRSKPQLLPTFWDIFDVAKIKRFVKSYLSVKPVSFNMNTRERALSSRIAQTSIYHILVISNYKVPSKTIRYPFLRTNMNISLVGTCR